MRKRDGLRSFPNSRLACKTWKDFPISTFCGSSIAAKVANWWARRPVIRTLTACLPRGRPVAPIRSGLTVVRLLGREGNRLRVRGVDMLDGTPILDIKPYLSNVPDSELKRGWLAEAEARREDRK